MTEPSDVLRELQRGLLLARRRRAGSAPLALLRLAREGAGWRLEASFGGHPPAVVLRPGAGTLRFGASGFLVGVFDDVEFTTSRLVLGPGETLVLYTDGVTDAQNGDAHFGEERLMDLLEVLGPRSGPARARRAGRDPGLPGPAPGRHRDARRARADGAASQLTPPPRSAVQADRHGLHAVDDRLGVVGELLGRARRGRGRGSAGPGRGTPPAAPSGPARRRRSGGSRSRTPGGTTVGARRVEPVARGVGARVAVGRRAGAPSRRSPCGSCARRRRRRAWRSAGRRPARPRGGAAAPRRSA